MVCGLIRVVPPAVYWYSTGKRFGANMHQGYVDERWENADCRRDLPQVLDPAAHPCYRLPMTPTDHPRRGPGCAAPRHPGAPTGGVSHAVAFSSDTVASTSRPRLTLKRESKLNAPKRDRMMLAWWSRKLSTTLPQHRCGVGALPPDLCCIDIAAQSQDGVSPATTSNRIPQLQQTSAASRQPHRRRTRLDALAGPMLG